MSDDALTAQLVERIMGWKIGPDRFIKSGRSWIPRWRFRPFLDPSNALELLDKAADRFRVTSPSRNVFIAEVRIHGRCGKASGEEFARTIVTALARALRLKA